jgi:YkoY family integral membrane protein
MSIWEVISNLWQQIISQPTNSILIVLNLILIESLLSVDNAAVIATMVMDLPKEQRSKALKYGIWGAYLFRGIAMLFVSVLISIWWLKPLGGLYLLYLGIKHFISKYNKGLAEHEPEINKSKNWLYTLIVGKLGIFWSTIIMVEVMDMAFSIDNVFAAVAFTKNIMLVVIGVFIGILAMRYVAQYFVHLLEKHPQLADAAFLVIAILGLKLTLSSLEHFYPNASLVNFINSHAADIGLSILTVLIFIFPLLLQKNKKQ